MKSSNDEFQLKGVAAAPGIATGYAFILDKQEFLISPRSIMEEEVLIEIARFEEALQKARQEIVDIQQKVSEKIQAQQARIFDAHLMVLEDRALIDDVVKRIKEEKLAAEYVFSEVIKKYAKVFSQIEDSYLKERVSDINDVGRRVLKNLVNEDKLHEFDGLDEEMILVSHDLSPSDTASMYNKKVLAFVTDIGGKTSHTAIMAKSLGVPAVVGLKDATLKIHNQDFIIVDGRKGLVFVNPTEETKEFYQGAKSRIIEFQGQYESIKDLPAETKDGVTVELHANVELPQEVPTLKKYGASGIGLYRTEYFYMNRVDLPSEEEQYTAYKKVAEGVGSNEVTIRTLDLGGDKFISSLQIPKDMYSYLGWRAIRFCLARPDIFKTQLRAILRASAHGNIRMMYPMITGVQELREANKILDDVKAELREQNIAFNEDMPVGVMIEVPSAAVVSDLLAKEADFFSIGTNDLIQYTLAIDRVNEQTAELYQPEHPAVLRFINMTVEAARKANIDVSLCGEIAGDPILTVLLIGLGFEKLSMSAGSILHIKNLIRNINYEDAHQLVQHVLKLSTGVEVEAYSRRKLKELAPGFIVDN
ncbi:MAG: phosphoenolpyruvate--protein phosphotransferase [Candidatus Omnitrophica bacterium]|nr:phosphoenolpyruvate--protein phosphotransferase [Candidatus Omnitrophota bacterium]